MTGSQKIAVDFGHTVRKHRKKQGMSQEAFALKAGVHRTYISSIELGKVEISIAIADRLAKALNTKLSSLIKSVGF